MKKKLRIKEIEQKDALGESGQRLTEKSEEYGRFESLARKVLSSTRSKDQKALS